MSAIYEGDTVSVRGEVLRVDATQITIRLKGYGIPVTLDRSHVELVQQEPRPPQPAVS